MRSSAGNVQRLAPVSPAAVPRTRRWETVIFLVVALAIGWFYVWSARTEDATWHFGQRQTDYYNLLVDGMLKGHLSLDVAVPPELLAVADPYNPADRPPGIALHDASLYRGKYYLYFGVAPVVTLVLPFRLITHTALPLPAAVVVFAYAGFLASAATWWFIRRRYFPRSSTVVAALVLVALGTASMVPVLVRRPNIWELPLAAGYCYAAVAVLCVYLSLHAVRAASAWFAAAGVAVGLAVGSRPTYLFAFGLLMVPAVLRFRDVGGRAGRRDAVTYLLAGLVPLVAVGIALAAYNYARFGNPLEFGQSYQLSGMYEGRLQHFSWAYFPHNVALYGFAPFDWSRYFPFIHAMKPAAGPGGYVGVEEPCGVLLHMPLLWFALFAPLAIRQVVATARRPLATWVGGAAAMAAGMLVTLGFFSAVGRYEVDFVPWFLLLAAVGVLGVESAFQDVRRWRRAGAAAVMGGIVLGSAAFGVLFSLVVYGNFQRSNPGAYAALAHVLDYPAYWMRRWDANRSGAVECVVRFPARPAATREPLVSGGWYHARDHVFVEYRGDGQFRLGCAHDGGSRFLSRWIAVEPAKTYRVRIELGSLYPPEEDPVYNGWRAETVARITRRVRVELDGAPIIDHYYRFESAGTAGLRVGSDDDAADFGSRFSGQILAVSRDGNLSRSHSASCDPAGQDEGSGPADFERMTMEVALPVRRPVGVREPVIVTGVTGGADFLWIEYLDERHVRFGLEHWGKPGIPSPAIDWPGTAARSLDVALGSFPAAVGSDRTARERVTVRLEGDLVWTTPARFYLADRTDVFVARNPLGGTACAPRFTGVISDVKRIAGE